MREKDQERQSVRERETETKTGEERIQVKIPISSSDVSLPIQKKNQGKKVNTALYFFSVGGKIFRPLGERERIAMTFRAQGRLRWRLRKVRLWDSLHFANQLGMIIQSSIKQSPFVTGAYKCSNNFHRRGKTHNRVHLLITTLCARYAAQPNRNIRTHNNERWL